MGRPLHALYPLRFREILRNYGFGDRWIASAFEKEHLPAEHRLAETWEVCDRPGESSEVLNGPLKGMSLRALIDAYGADLLGSDVVARFGQRFPLLIKFLDASHVLGEQAHHSDALARRRGLEDPGKTEAWYMLRVREGATIACGPRPDVTEERVRAALQAGTIREQMQEYAVGPGDAFLLYAGTMHFSHGGVLFYEIMQNSDVYISLRGPEPGMSPAAQQARIEEQMEGLHLESGFDCRTAPITLMEGLNRRTYVLACEHFALERLDLREPRTLHLNGERFHIVSQIEGRTEVIHGSERIMLYPGWSCLLPATLGEVALAPLETGALLDAYVPDLARDVVAPLRAAGIADGDIVALGGRTKLNPLLALVTQVM